MVDIGAVGSDSGSDSVTAVDIAAVVAVMTDGRDRYDTDTVWQAVPGSGEWSYRNIP
jgi:hypothetical protein